MPRASCSRSLPGSRTTGAGAMKWYAAILTDPEAPASSRTRVEMLIALSAADGKS